VVGGSVCVAAACLIESNPLIGLLGATTFAILTAFTMLFHSGRLVAVPWTIGALTLVVLATRLDPHNIAVAACSFVVVTLLNVAVAVAGRFLIQILDSELLRCDDIEPLTGLLSRDAFYDEVATLIGARSRRDDRYLVVVAVSLDSFTLLTALAGAVGGNRALVAISQALREAVRRGTVVAHLPEADFLIAELFATADPGPLTERVRGTISTAPFGLTASIGAVSTPLGPLAGHPSSEVLDEMLSLATDAMRAARRAGGNQVGLRLSPCLSSLNDPAPG
jgi:GGDEF domain-containing protein